LLLIGVELMSADPWQLLRQIEEDGGLFPAIRPIAEHQR
jgi:hypothetical protein